MTTSANATMTKFGYPHTVVEDYACWTVQLRPKQVTLGSLVLVCKSPVTEFHRIGSKAFSELETVCTDVATALARSIAYERVNYLMLMMVDPDVHFHVIPRYSAPRTFAGVAFPDDGWPGPPDLKSGIETDARMRDELVKELRTVWKRGAT